jgi:FkbM family methyltransferase
MPDASIFQAFAGYRGPEAENVDWIGMRYSPAWWPWPATPEKPTPSEDYFEWIDLLEAVSAAEDRFTMLDLGAGFGRWGIRAALAAKQRGLRDIDIRLVEAEPQHVAWLREAIEMNGLTEEEIAVWDAVVSYTTEPVPFSISLKGHGEDAYSWWGQSAVKVSNPKATNRSYCGHPVYESGLGHELVYVQPVTLETLSQDLAVIDLVNMDIQGAERELIENAIATFSAKVRRVHIGTHGVAIEDAIRKTFRDDGWVCRWDFSVSGERETPYGVACFQDGVQSWCNPRLTSGVV